MDRKSRKEFYFDLVMACLKNTQPLGFVIDLEKKLYSFSYNKY